MYNILHSITVRCLKEIETFNSTILNLNYHPPLKSNQFSYGLPKLVMSVLPRPRRQFQSEVTREPIQT